MLKGYTGLTREDSIIGLAKKKKKTPEKDINATPKIRKSPKKDIYESPSKRANV